MTRRARGCGVRAALAWLTHFPTVPGAHPCPVPHSAPQQASSRSASPPRSPPAPRPAPPARSPSAAAGDPVTGGTLTYLEHQTYTNLYPPQAGFYPNGGLVNNIAARLTWQNPETLEIEPWIATDWTVNEDATEYTFNLRDDVTFSDGTPLDAAAVAKNFDVYGLGNADLGLTDLGGDQQLRRAARSSTRTP